MELEVISDGIGACLCCMECLYAIASTKHGRLILYSLKILGYLLDITAIIVSFTSGNSTVGYTLLILFLYSTIPTLIFLCCRYSQVSKAKEVTNEKFIELAVKPPANYYKYIREVAHVSQNTSINTQQQESNERKGRYSDYNIDTIWYSSLFRFDDCTVKFCAYNTWHTGDYDLPKQEWTVHYNLEKGLYSWQAFGTCYIWTYVGSGILELGIMASFFIVGFSATDDNYEGFYETVGGTFARLLAGLSMLTSLFGILQRYFAMIVLIWNKKYRKDMTKTMAICVPAIIWVLLYLFFGGLIIVSIIFDPQKNNRD